MYKLILVDDEEEVRKGIVRKIEWGKYGFEIAGEAENGKEALDIAEKVNPDVVITDIKMPFMDGMRLSEELKEKFPTAKVVILTGFDEFEFARKAIKLNVIEYILKPISSQELIEVLKRIKSKLDEEIEQKEDIQKLKDYYSKSLPILREKFLTTLITNRLNKEEIVEKSTNYGIYLKGNSFLVSVISIDFNTIEKTDEYIENSKDEKFNVSEDKELVKFAVLNISEEILGKHNGGIVFIHNDYLVVIASSVDEKCGKLVNKCMSMLEEIRLCMEKYLHFTVTIGIGSVCNSVTELSNSYNNAISALDYRMLLGNNRVIYIADVEPNRMERVIFDELKEHSLASTIKIGTVTEIVEIIDNLFKEIIDSKASFKEYQVYLLEMLTTILKAAKDINVAASPVY